MPQVQTSYVEQHGEAAAGLVANTRTADVDSGRVEGAGAIGFGRAVRAGTDPDQVQAGLDATSAALASASFAGISILDKTLRPEQNDTYVRGDIASILSRGDIWVEVEEAVSKGDDVTARADDGRLSSRAAAAAGGGRPLQAAIRHAVFRTSAAAGGLALVRLHHAPSLT